MEVKRMVETADLDTDDATRAIALAAAIKNLINGEDVGVAGAALGAALGYWLKEQRLDVKTQEKVLDKILLVTAQALR